MKYLTENQILAITLLAIYKYLTSSQFVKLGVFKKRAYLTNALKTLLDAKQPLIAKHDFNPLNGKLESLYYLTKYGVKFLIEELDYIFYFDNNNSSNYTLALLLSLSFITTHDNSFSIFLSLCITY